MTRAEILSIDSFRLIGNKQEQLPIIANRMRKQAPQLLYCFVTQILAFLFIPEPWTNFEKQLFQFEWLTMCVSRVIKAVCCLRWMILLLLLLLLTA